MAYIATINAIDADHLEAVKAQMLELGAPEIRCVRDEAQGIFVALEGSHRLAAAHELGIVPVLKVLEGDEMILCDDIGYDDCGYFEGEPASAGEIAERIGSPMGSYSGCPMISFDEVVEV